MEIRLELVEDTRVVRVQQNWEGMSADHRAMGVNEPIYHR